MPANSEQFEALLEKIREDFLAELPNRCHKIEQAMLDLNKYPDDQDIFNSVYRDIHSLKGSGGTHGLSLISTICHQIENSLTLAHQTHEFSSSFLKTSLSICDLIKETTELYSARAKDFSSIEQKLETIKKEILNNKKSVLIVESSIVMKQMFNKALGKINARFDETDDGLTALHTLFHEKFDLIILSGEIKSLNAKALIAAIREGRNVNSKTAIILISSNEDPLFPYQNSIIFIRKDQEMTANLEQRAMAILKRT